MGLLDKAKQLGQQAADAAKKGTTQVQGKIEHAQTKKKADELAEQLGYLVVMRSQADVSAADRLGTKEAKGEFVYRTLRANADRTQAPVRALLDARGIAYESHFLVNLIAVLRGDRALVQTLAARPDVA